MWVCLCRVFVGVVSGVEGGPVPSMLRRAWILLLIYRRQAQRASGRKKKKKKGKSY